MAQRARKSPARTKTVNLTSDRMEDLAAFLHELCPFSPTPENPIAVTGRHDGRVWRRLKATYASGWVVTVNADRDGNVTSSSARILAFSGKVVG